MFESLSERLEKSLKILKGEGRITEINIAETLKEVRRALQAADVNFKVAKNFTDEVKKKALGQKILTAVKPKDMMVKIVHDEMAALMGGNAAPINLDGRPAVILLAGLQGAGKTTFAAKLANKLKSTKGKRPLLVGGDVYRPAAREQLRQLGEKIKIPVFTDDEGTDPLKIARDAIDYAKTNHHDVVIVDTAGRLDIDEDMMKEISSLKENLQPQEVLFVVDSMIGQSAVDTAKAFNDRIDYDGVILTKLDGDTRGGAALSIRAVVNKPIKFVGTGEKMGDIEEFNPEGMASRILGMGDIVALVERIQTNYDLKEAERLQEKLRKNKFDFEDFRGQIAQIKKMGNLKDLASMIPGVGKAIKDIEIDDNAFKGIEAIINSMTPYERQNPDVIKGMRRQRIAKGSGTSLQEVNRLLKQFEEMRKMMHKATNMGNPAKMMSKIKDLESRMRNGRRR